MGGSGSGWRRWTRTTVEDCLVLSAAKLMRDQALYPGLKSRSSLSWSNTLTGEELSSIGFDVNLESDSGLARLYCAGSPSGEQVDYTVELTTTPLPWGGRRWWFICPLMVNDGPCGRRVGKLYLPPGGRYFGCRQCYDLTYTSCQQSHKFDGLLAAVGAPMGLSARGVQKLLSARGRSRRAKI